jgi:hypothetical protein
VRPNGRPKFYQVRKGQLEATARAQFYTDIKPHLNDATYRL